MFKRLRISFFCAAIFLVWGVPAQSRAENPVWLFWSPGAEGTPEQAQPILEALIDYLQKKEWPIALTPRFSQAAVTEEKSVLEQNHPALAVISLEAYLSLAQERDLQILAQTQPLGGKTGTIQYSVIQKKGTSVASPIYSSEPLSGHFVQKILFPRRPEYQNIAPHYTAQALQTLKQIASAQKTGAVLLNAQESHVLKQLNTPWSKELQESRRSRPIPTPPLVLFKQYQDQIPQEKLLKILFGMSNDPQGREILKELRLHGFMPPRHEDYLKMLSEFAAP